MPPDPVEAVALFRFHLIAEALNPAVGAAERGLIIRGLACLAHPHPDGTMRVYSRGTLDRWIRAYRARGLEGLRPVPRSDVGAVRRHPELLAEAAALRAEVPARSSGAIADMLWRRHGVRVAERTIRSHLHRRGLHRAAVGGVPGLSAATRPPRPTSAGSPMCWSTPSCPTRGWPAPGGPSSS